MTVDSPTQWAASLPREHASLVAALWERPDIEVLATDSHLWLRGHSCDDVLRDSLRSLLHCERYQVDAEDRLVPEAAIVPVGHLPSGDWVPLQAACNISAPNRAVAGAINGRVDLRLVRTESGSEANCVLASIDAWTSYASTAPEVRLAQLTFAAAQDRRVFVRGTPIPSLPAKPYYESDGVAVPLGMRLEPAVPMLVLRRSLNADDGEVLLVEPADKSRAPVVHRIKDDDFVAATRSAVRLTCDELGRDDAEVGDVAH